MWYNQGIMTREIFTGTSGYDYPEWKGLFYPEALPRKDYLAYYATQFNGLELNNTFYSMPDTKRINSFVERTEEKVAFCIKACRCFTHERSSLWMQQAYNFKKALEPMTQKALVLSVLFQLPHNFLYTAENRKYLTQLLEEFKDLPCTVEFRNAAWIKPSVFEGLAQRKASLAFCDMPAPVNADGNVTTNFTGPVAYCRLHARNKNAWYATDSTERFYYSKEELKKFVSVVKLASEEGRNPAVFFNRSADGVRNAMEFREMILR